VPALFVYGDLLYPVEIACAVGVTALAVVGGWQVAILRLDAPGHPRTMIVSSADENLENIRRNPLRQTGGNDPRNRWRSSLIRKTLLFLFLFCSPL
jgi:hypothetical protein